ncbi:killer toxin resistant protein [Mucor circinelloides]
MTNIVSLPAELLSVIFDNVESNLQLAECRLVCRKWNDPAARSMLGNKITINSEKAASRLFRHLFLDPSKIPLIRHLDFRLDEDNLPMNIYKLLLLTFTPSIVNLTGSVKSKRFFTALFDIVDTSPQTFANLATLPLYSGSDADFNTTVALKFKDSLLYPTLRLSGQTTQTTKDFLKDLDQFQNLGMVILRGHVNGLEWMEDLLKSNSDLEGFGVINFEFKGFGPTLTRIGGMDSWFASSVQQENSLQYLMISSVCRPEVLEYFSYKYPELKYLELKGRVWLPERGLPTESDVFTTVDRILNVAKKIECKVISLVLPRNASLMAAIKYVSGREEDIEFDIADFRGETEVILNLTNVADEIPTDGFLQLFY